MLPEQGSDLIAQTQRPCSLLKLNHTFTDTGVSASIFRKRFSYKDNLETFFLAQMCRRGCFEIMLIVLIRSKVKFTLECKKSLTSRVSLS